MLFLKSAGFFASEVTVINKQKFLAELAKLLTFMYEEDRQRALGVYNEMFDEAEDEQALLQALVSPLRQAVEVARAYNSGKPALGQDPKKEPEDEADKNDHAFLDTIYRIRAEAFSGQPEKELIDEDQISLFDAPQEEPEEEEEAAGEENEAEETAEAPEGEEAKDEEAEEAGEEDAEEPDRTPLTRAESEPEPEKSVDIQAEPARLPVQKTVRKPRVLLLILYILIAIPLTLLGIVLLLIPALISLVVAVVCIAVAVMGIIAAFGSGFPTIANLLVALGAAVILLALGLLFLMLFIWFLGGAIGGMIHGVIELGGKWCYKEVAAK